MRGSATIVILPLLAVGILAGGLAFACWYEGRVADAGSDKEAAPDSAAGCPACETQEGEIIPAAGLLQIRSKVPEFTFTNEDGLPFGSRDLLGKVWIADFIYVKCAGPCPAMTVSMKKLHDFTEDMPGLHFATFTVDPDRDSVEDLKSYSQNTDADPERWHFIRGEANELANVMRKGFLLGSDDNPLNHSTLFCLVDQTGRVRGHYDHKRGDEMVRLRKHALLLLTGERP